MRPSQRASETTLDELIKLKLRVSMIFCSLILAAYFAFIIVLATNKPLLAQSFGDLPLGITVGVGLILFSWLLTGAYALWANSYYDHHVKALVKKRGA